MNKFKKFETPYKLNEPVVVGSGMEGSFDSRAVDCPFVFFHNNQYHMLYIGFDGKGYQTALASSDDLIQWSFKGLVLKREDHVGWDQVGAAGTWIIKEDDINKKPRLKKIDNKYWMIYHSYPGEGYEAGPASIGLAWCEDEDLQKWHRLKDPVFTYKEGKDWESGGLYKACIIQKAGRYYMFYNAKNKVKEGEAWIEQTGLAFSDNLHQWTRYQDNPVLKVKEESWSSRFVSDPCVISDGEDYYMFYFGYDNDKAQEGLAWSKDLYHWETREDPIIKHGEKGMLDEHYAHKPSVIKDNGIIYHYYCAARDAKEGDPTVNFGKEFRSITLATSIKIRGNESENY